MRLFFVLDLWADVHKMIDAMTTSFVLLILGFWLATAAFVLAATHLS